MTIPHEVVRGGQFCDVGHVDIEQRTGIGDDYCLVRLVVGTSSHGKDERRRKLEEEEEE